MAQKWVRRRKMTRRTMMQAASSAAAAVAWRTLMAQNSTQSSPLVKALLFDTFGTVVDWRGSIIDEGKTWEKSKGLSINWGRFADQWRAGYAPSMDRVRHGEIPWTNLDHLHRARLDELLKEFGIDGLSEDDKDHLNRVWHRLTPWPDSVAGLARLKRKYTIAPLSNGNVALLTDMAKHAGLPWDLILSAELAKHYKPDREAYLTAVTLLELKPEEVMMCAAHSNDLKAARSFGLRTAFIHRPKEYGPTRQADDAKPGDFDFVSADIIDLASQLGA
jgi:2-haloacid dehalogenase